MYIRTTSTIKLKIEIPAYLTDINKVYEYAERKYYEGLLAHYAFPEFQDACIEIITDEEAQEDDGYEVIND